MNHSSLKCVFESYNYRMTWVEKDHNDHWVSTPLLCAGSPATRPGCPEPHPAWPWMPPGMGHPQPPRATCSRDNNQALTALKVVFYLYEYRLSVYKIPVHSTVFAGTGYSRLILTRLSPRCTSSFPAVPINYSDLLQRDPSHKSACSMLLEVCSKNLAWENSFWEDMQLFILALL